MSRLTAVSDLDYEAEANPQPRRIELICTTCGDPVDWYVSDGPPARPVTCGSCQDTLMQDARNAAHRREYARSQR